MLDWQQAEKSVPLWLWRLAMQSCSCKAPPRQESKALRAEDCLWMSARQGYSYTVGHFYCRSWYTFELRAPLTPFFFFKRLCVLPVLQHRWYWNPLVLSHLCRLRAAGHGGPEWSKSKSQGDKSRSSEWVPTGCAAPSGWGEKTVSQWQNRQPQHPKTPYLVVNLWSETSFSSCEIR